MSGLKQICKAYGSIVVTVQGGKEVKYVWDYANDAPVLEGDMPPGSDRHKKSELAKYKKVSGLMGMV